MNIGLSLLPFGRKYTAEYINMAHLLGIKHFEISTESSCYSEDFIANGEIYSIHAPKNILDETDLRRLRSELERLRDFCETVQCHRLVFHPNVNVESNDSVFSVLSEVMADYAIWCYKRISISESVVCIFLKRSRYFNKKIPRALFCVWGKSGNMFPVEGGLKDVEFYSKNDKRGKD